MFTDTSDVDVRRAFFVNSDDADAAEAAGYCLTGQPACPTSRFLKNDPGKPVQCIPTCGLTPDTHSALNACAGSRPAARRAGNHPASAATPARIAAAAIIVAGSKGLTPNNSAPNTRVSANAPATPTAIPMPATTAACRETIRRTSTGRAPSAIRTAISRVRRLTTYEITP